jgi:predicted kinase
LKPILYIFSGLPATGKTTLAKLLSQHIQAVYLRIDTIEQGLKDLCDYKVLGEGYALAHRLAADNLKLGNLVVADSVNPWPLTRNEWENVALSCGNDFVNIEVICSDQDEHQRRAESRKADIAGHQLPDWQVILNRDYHAWTKERVVIDTAHQSVRASFKSMQVKLASLADPKHSGRSRTT